MIRSTCRSHDVPARAPRVNKKSAIKREKKNSKRRARAERRDIYFRECYNNRRVTKNQARVLTSAITNSIMYLGRRSDGYKVFPIGPTTAAQGGKKAALFNELS